MVRRRARGFTYLTALFVVAILAGGLALAGTVWEQQAAREREAELLFIGQQYRRAIGLYYDNTPGATKQYPRALEDLLKDQRQPATQRFLRKLYPDPLGGKEWGVVKGSDGGIAGVYSLSEAKPVKVSGFKVRDASFEGAQTYAAWKFTHTPATPPAGTKPAAGAAPMAPGAAPMAAPASPAAITTSPPVTSPSDDPAAEGSNN